MPGRLLVAALLGLWVSPCRAHWTDHPDLPAWSQRGRIYWCLHYARANRQLVDLFLAGGQTFLHGGSFDSPATARYALEHGLRYMPYVCSRTCRTQEIERAPQLKNAVLLKEDRSEFLAYNNPVRRYGSLYVPAWPEYVRERVRRVWSGPDVAAIFFDNAFWAGDDHNPATVKAWRAWAARHGLRPGKDVPSIYSGPLAAGSRAYSADSLIRYHAGLRAFCHQHGPPLLNCPNAGNAYGLAAAAAGAIDLFFYETMSHPPFANNAFRYKAGLAATHGRPTALLAYLPPRVAAQRGERIWHEGMHHYFYPSSPLPEEFALAAAEGAACGGIYVVNYNLFPSLPITDTTDPFCRRVHREIKRSYSFLHANEELYAESRPGGVVGVLYSPITDLNNRRLQNVHALGAALTAAGIPFEVVVPADLSSGGMASIRSLVLPNVLYMGEATAEGVFRFVRGGGRAVISGDYAVYDPVGRPAHWAAAKSLLAPLRLTSRAIRAWDLDGFEPEGVAHVRVKKTTGRASLRFQGTPGRYVAHFSLTDENDGTSEISFLAGGKTVFKGRLDAEDNQQHWLTTSAFDLASGDTVQLTVHADAGERGRLFSIVLAGAESGDGAPLGQGRVFYSPIGLEQLPPGQVVSLLRPKVQLPRPDKVFLNVTHLPGRKLRAFHLVNYDFRYEVTREGLYASDDGEQNARMFFSDAPKVIRKRIVIPDPGAVAQPVVQIHGMAMPLCVGALSVQVNGRPAGIFKATEMHGRGWYETPIDRTLLRKENFVEIKGKGDLDGQTKWVQIGIDTDTQSGGSWLSEDGGATFTGEDLSTDLKKQVGEYMVRIEDKAPGEVGRDPANLVQNPGFERTRTPHSETRLTVSPAENLEIEVDGTARQECLAISPDGPPRWIQSFAREGRTIYTVPRVHIYTLLLLAEERPRLEPIRARQMESSPWAFPAVMEALRERMLNWSGYGEGFKTEARETHGGRRSIRCENTGETEVRGATQIVKFDANPPDRLTVSAWSRCRNVSGRPDAHYSVYVDAICTDNSVFNGRYASFKTGTHGWQQAVLRLSPPAPIRTMRLYLLFRKHSGTAWFDDIKLMRFHQP